MWQEKSPAQGKLWLGAAAWEGLCVAAEADVGTSESPRVGVQHEASLTSQTCN